MRSNDACIQMMSTFAISPSSEVLHILYLISYACTECELMQVPKYFVIVRVEIFYFPAQNIACDFVAQITLMSNRTMLLPIT